ncbi:MAG TPA: hypothetical protein VNZ52_04690 [Candidatus Thermoplasmatota archaeon]|nr:hypothetical protein [Candidatus Thermoplasmatota archaeon]
MTHGKPHQPLLALAAAVVLLFGAVGVAAAQDPAGASAPRYRYTFVFVEENVTAPRLEGAGDEGQPVRFTLPGAPTNLTGLTATLRWRDDVGDPDRLSFLLIAPNGAGHGPVANESTDGVLSLSARAGSAPDGKVAIEAATEDEAWREFKARNPTIPAMEWRAEVTVESAGDAIVAGIPVEEDRGNRWGVEVTYTTYRAVLAGKEELPPPDEEPDENPDETPCLEDGTGCEDIDDENLTGEDETLLELSPRSNSKGFFTPMKLGLLVGAIVLGTGAALLVARRGKK